MGTKQHIDVKEDLELDAKQPELACGIVMPIAAMGDYSANHWSDVYAIIKEAVGKAGYSAKLVSESDDSTVIPKSIVQNLYDDDIVICDVSGKNPNVMFELGMRLAFNKPVVLIKDDVTGYSFDTSTIEHLTYPRDLRYSAIQTFKDVLASKLLATYEASLKPDYRSFLSNFASIKIAHLEHTTVDEAEALEKILRKLDVIEGRMNTVERDNIINSSTSNTEFKKFLSASSGSLIPSVAFVFYDEMAKDVTKSEIKNIETILSEISTPQNQFKVETYVKNGVTYLRVYSNRSPDSSMLRSFYSKVKPYLETLK